MRESIHIQLQQRDEEDTHQYRIIEEYFDALINHRWNDIAKELGITIIAWSPLGSGLLTGKFHRDPEVLKKTPVGRRAMLSRQVESSRGLIGALDEIADAHQVTTAQVALNWLVNYHGDTVVAIPGASKVHHASESASSMDFSLTEDEMARIDDLSRQFR